MVEWRVVEDFSVIARRAVCECVCDGRAKKVDPAIFLAIRRAPRCRRGIASSSS